VGFKQPGKSTCTKDKMQGKPSDATREGGLDGGSSDWFSKNVGTGKAGGLGLERRNRGESGPTGKPECRWKPREGIPQRGNGYLPDSKKIRASGKGKEKTNCGTRPDGDRRGGGIGIENRSMKVACRLTWDPGERRSID